MTGTLRCGVCEVRLVADSGVETSARLVLALSAQGSYVATREREDATLELADVCLYTRVQEVAEPLHILDKTPLQWTLRREYQAAGVATTVGAVLRPLELVVTYQDTKRLYGLCTVSYTHLTLPTKRIV